MIRKNELLSNVRIASPCPASWSEMEGDDQVRFCKECKLNVYNLSEMPADAAEQLLRNREGRLCVRFYQRADGAVMTKDCPKGLRAIRKRLAWAWSAGLAAVFSGFGCSVVQGDATQGAAAVPDNSQVMGKMPDNNATVGIVAQPELTGEVIASPPARK